MKKIALFLLLYCFKAHSLVIYSNSYVIPHELSGSCNPNYFAEIGFFTLSEVGNSQFQIQKSADPDFTNIIVPTTDFTFSGCGTCGGRQYTVYDYGEFHVGEIWYYRVKSMSNIFVDYYFLGTFTVNPPTVVNWTNQVSTHVDIYSSSSNEQDYSWHQEFNNIQGINLSLLNLEKKKIYVEQNNQKINFHFDQISFFSKMDVQIDGNGYFNIYEGELVSNYYWQNSSNSFGSLGEHELEIRYWDGLGEYHNKEYTVVVVPISNSLYIDNHCNSMRVWKSSNNSNGIPMLLCEGFDPYNIKSEQFFRNSFNELITCFNKKGYDIYILNLANGGQSIVNNAAVYQSAVRYLSAINENKKVIASGMSMGAVICRYACAKAENDGVPLPIYKMISFDGPQQGANMSLELQEFLDNHSADNYTKYIANCQAAKELLIDNYYDPTGQVHNDFYSSLNGLNGDGYPHLIECIAVSFSTTTPNPNSGGWLEIYSPQLLPTIQIEMTGNDFLPGSYLPKFSALLGSWTYFMFTIELFANQIKDPTFIPYSSAIDIRGGGSMFDHVLIPDYTRSHDELPSELIEDLLQLIKYNDVYIQDVVYENIVKTIISNDFIKAGNNVTSSIPQGLVDIKGGSSIVSFKAKNSINLMDGFQASAGANFSAMIENVEIYCDNIFYSQSRSSVGADYSFSSYLPFERDGTVNERSYNQPSASCLIYPNPTNQYINISFPENSMSMPFIIKIYDITGKLVECETVASVKMLSYNLSKYGKGIYMVAISFGDIVENHKVVVN